ncbi:hypothetical protein RAB70_17505 [Xanthomonas sontii]|uniref:hypothetical protein n=1 Tax=Xanthomonas sontii TaxID=2650745 RepID=UPI001CECA394|nr:hypothetical protein [Xanthomonas sontii]MDQ7759019.1 hypothetical protein [Xanthomonas sontii]
MHPLPPRTPEEEIAEMAGDEKSKDSAKEGLPHLSLMEKAWDAQWVMRFVCIVLFVDAALVFKGGKGILQWSTSADMLWKDLGFLVVSAATFGLLVSFVLPLLGAGVRWFVFLFPGVGVDSSDRGSERYGEVSAMKLLDLALERESDFLLRMHDGEWRNWKDRLSEDGRLGDLVFATLAMAAADCALAFTHVGGRSLVLDLILQLGDAGILLAALLVWAACWMLRKTWFAPLPSLRVYYPPLYRELREKELRRKDE